MLLMIMIVFFIVLISIQFGLMIYMSACLVSWWEQTIKLVLNFVGCSETGSDYDFIKLSNWSLLLNHLLLIQSPYFNNLRSIWFVYLSTILSI